MCDELWSLIGLIWTSIGSSARSNSWTVWCGVSVDIYGLEVVFYHVDIHDEGCEGVCDVCVSGAWRWWCEGRMGWEWVKLLVINLVRSKFVIRKVIRILEDPAHVAARLTRLPTSTHEGRLSFHHRFMCPICSTGNLSTCLVWLVVMRIVHQLYVVSSTVSVRCLFPRCPLHI